MTVPISGDVDEIVERCRVGIDRFPPAGKECLRVVIGECVVLVHQGLQFSPGKTVLPDEMIQLVPAA